MSRLVPRCSAVLISLYLLNSALGGSNDDEARQGTAVECYMDDTDLTYLYFDAETQVGIEPHPVFEASGMPKMAVRECWCARFLSRHGDYCEPQFDTCFVPGTRGEVICSKDNTTLNVARGVWPFSIFLSVTTLYLLVASESGRRARGYCKRQCGNGRAHLRRWRIVRQEQGPNIEGNSEMHLERDEEGGALAVTPLSIGDSSPSTRGDAEQAAEPALPLTEFGSWENYTQLSNELRYMYRHEPERLARLWQSAWLRERRTVLRGATRRGRLQRATRPWVAPSNAENRVSTQILDQHQSESNVEQQPPRDNVWPWWDTRRTIRLELKTKRFQGDSMTRNITNLEHPLSDGHHENCIGEIMPHNVIPGEEVLQHAIPGKNANSVETHRPSATAEGEDTEQAANDCAICLSQLENGDLVGDIPCGHVFHKNCLKAWVPRSRRCPLCNHEGMVSFEVLTGPIHRGRGAGTDSTPTA